METLKTIWDFFQNEVLGMNWLNRLIETFLNACGLDTTGKIGGSVQFFIYDTVKIMVLLGVLILIISYIQSYFPPERAKKILGRFHGIWANIIAALLGTVTPFCSCSSIPLFIGFICGNKTRTMIREDTELRNFPLYCPKCKKETSINAQDMKVTLAEHK